MLTQCKRLGLSACPTPSRTVAAVKLVAVCRHASLKLQHCLHICCDKHLTDSATSAATHSLKEASGGLS